MDTVTEARLAITLAQEGGIGIIHKNMSPAEQARQVQIVKKFESGIISDPITIDPDATIRDVIELTRAENISGVPVVRGQELVGIVTGRHRDAGWIEEIELLGELGIPAVDYPADELADELEAAL